MIDRFSTNIRSIRNELRGEISIINKRIIAISRPPFPITNTQVPILPST